MNVLIIPGDGIGPEVTHAAVEVLRATGLSLDFSEAEAGWGAFQRTGAALPEATLEAARAADVILFGAVASPSHPVAGYKSPIVGLRRTLELYANIRPTEDGGRWTGDEGRSPIVHHSLSTVLRPPFPVNLVIVRENTEGLYSGRERVEDNGDTAITERVITRRASERIVRTAFELARARSQHAPSGRQAQVTLVHKANVLRETCGLFRRVGLEVAAEYPDVLCDELLVDTAALQLVQRPERFDVIVTTNLFGDILSDIACYWGGGMGMATSANIGTHHALFEPVHGAAPDIAERGIANPLAAIGCAAMLLEHVAGRSHQSGAAGQYTEAAQHIRQAVQRVLLEGPHSPDLGGDARTDDITSAVIAAMGTTRAMA